MENESMHYDVVIVGAGPSGLSAAIKLKQLCKLHSLDLNVCILEKGSEVGAHILAGAVLEPRALNELLPDWESLSPPPFTPVLKDEFHILTNRKSMKLPTPPQMHNTDNYIISLGSWCRWLGQIAEEMGVEIFPGFAAQELIIEDEQVQGITTGDMGRDKDGHHKPTFQPGLKIFAKQTILAEGCRGSLTKSAMQNFNLGGKSAPQTYAIGLKELWKVPESVHQKGTAIHTIGWPLDTKTYGGSFIYHMHDNLISIGFVVGLDYKNPYLSPYQEFQRFKHHPFVYQFLEQSQIQSYGARALNEGGWQSLPKLTFPGGLIVGCAAGFLNVPKIKGIHTAMQSGIIAAESIFTALKESNAANEIINYKKNIDNSWIKKELYQVRNIRPGFKWGLWPGLLNAALETYIFRGHAPWTLAHHQDHLSTIEKSKANTIPYPKPDGKISFDRLSNLQRSNVFHEDNQPCHLILNDKSIPVKVNYEQFAGPEQRYCPAGVYEYTEDDSNNMTLTINAQNCLHCKTCDIKDPKQNINWVPPEGGGGPNYSQM